jgi:flavodoxin I
VWPTDGYNFEASRAVFEEGWFVGLALDEDNQSDLTMDRIREWLEQIAQDVNIKLMAAN